MPSSESPVSVAPYRAEDAREMRLGDHAAASLANIEDLDRVFQMYEAAGPAWTLRVGGQIVGCAGLMLMWPGVAHAWLMASPLSIQFPQIVTRVVVRGLRQAIREHKLVRVQCEVQTDFALGRRFVERLGFVAEGDMPKYGPGGETYTRYALILG